MAGVSPSTVSSILNGKEENRRISSSLAKKVLTIAKEAGYAPNQIAVSLRTGSSKIIGLLVEDISNIFYASVAGTIEDELKKYGYRVVYCSTKNDPSNCIELIDMLYQRQVDGYIITPVEGTKETLTSLSERNKPVILIDRYFSDLDLSFVLVDDKKGIYDGMNHLVENGFRKIGFVTVDLQQTQMNYREQAYREFIREYSIKDGENRILKIPWGIGTEESIELISGFIKGHPEMDALFFTTNYLCIAGIQSLQRMQIQIPDQMAVLSFDDHDLFEIYPPGITALRQPIEQIGHTAVELLMTFIANNKSSGHKHVFIEGELNKRGSTKKISSNISSL